MNNVEDKTEDKSQKNLNIVDEEPMVERSRCNEEFQVLLAKHIRNLGLRIPIR